MGIVALEFAAAVGSFVGSTLLPIVAGDLDARGRLGLLLAGGTLGFFVALPLANRVLGRLGAHGTLAAGTFAYVGGLSLAAIAQDAWMFATGQFLSGLAGGVLAVFGVSSAVRQLDDRLRIRVIAASSAMWIVPALIGPAATIGLQHLLGWRWTLLAPLPLVLFGRVLVVRAVRDDPPDQSARQRPLGRTFLIPLGAACVVLSGGWWPLVIGGTMITLAGMMTVLPAGTARLRPGTPAALGAMVLFAVGYFGADSLITVLLTTGFQRSLGQAATVLTAAPLAWAMTSIVITRLTSTRRFPTAGLSLTALGVSALAVQLVVGGSLAGILAAWTVAGVGVGAAYPGVYLAATTAGTSGFTAAELATAVITAEATGQLLGRAIGGTLSSADNTGGLLASYLLFAVALSASAVAAKRMSTTRSVSPGRSPHP